MINDLELKLEGKLPIDREELFDLVSSWGRKDFFTTYDDIDINECDPKECYDLSNLDVSQIKDLSYIFRESLYNGDLSKWDVSNCIDMNRMFGFSQFNNDSISNWNLSSCKDMTYMFSYSKFNGDISKWNVSNVANMSFLFYKAKFNGDISDWNVSNITTMRSAFDNCPFDGDISKWKFNENVSCYEIFCDNKNFQNKYNDGQKITKYTEDFLIWFEENKLKIASLSISKKEINDIDDYLDSFKFDDCLKKK